MSKFRCLSVSLLPGPLGCHPRCLSRGEGRGTEDSPVALSADERPNTRSSGSSGSISSTQLVSRLAATLRAVTHRAGFHPCLARVPGLGCLAQGLLSLGIHLEGRQILCEQALPGPSNENSSVG